MQYLQQAQKHVTHSVMSPFVTSWTVAHQAPLAIEFPRKDTGVGHYFLLQGIFSTQGLKPRSLLMFIFFQIIHTGFSVFYIYLWLLLFQRGVPRVSAGKEFICNAGDQLQCRRCGFDLWVKKSLWRKKWQSTPGFLPGESHGQRSLVGHRQWVT